MSFLRINRLGEVNSNLTSTNQCKDVGHKRYQYHICLVCPDTNTDDQEFVIDHVAIHKTVEKYFNRRMNSCEGLVKGLSVVIENLAKKHGTYVVDLYIKLAPIFDGPEPANRAYMEYSKSGNFI